MQGRCPSNVPNTCFMCSCVDHSESMGSFLLVADFFSVLHMNCIAEGHPLEERLAVSASGPHIWTQARKAGGVK